MMMRTLISHTRPADRDETQLMKMNGFVDLRYAFVFDAYP
jgi:hypothetical protein